MAVLLYNLIVLENGLLKLCLTSTYIAYIYKHLTGDSIITNTFLNCYKIKNMLMTLHLYNFELCFACCIVFNTIVYEFYLCKYNTPLLYIVVIDTMNQLSSIQFNDSIFLSVYKYVVILNSKINHIFSIMSIKND